MPSLLHGRTIEELSECSAVLRRGSASILHAVRNRDPDAATKAAQQMVCRVGNHISARLKELGVFAIHDGDTPDQGDAYLRREISELFRSGLSATTDESARQRASHKVANHLMTAIVRGELASNERLDQKLIAEAVGVSRTPVREAIIALDRSGWVTIEPHRGAFVNAFDATAVQDQYHLFAVIFAFATRRMSERIDPEGLSKLLDLSSALMAAGNPKEFERTDRRFLEFVVTEARSPTLINVLRLMPQLIPGRMFSRVPGTMDDHRRVVAAVCQAIVDGDMVAADEAWLIFERELARRVIKAFLESD
jgi:DNA-binding GntR family transcriptional regulator